MNTNKNFWIEFENLLKLEISELKLDSIKISNLIKTYFGRDIIIEYSYYNAVLEVVFCGGHDKAKISFIKDLLSTKPKIKNINIIGPKPALGFDFIIEINGKDINVENMLFYPLKSNKSSGLGLLLYIDGYKNLEIDLLWKIIETGIGEEQSLNVEYIEFTYKNNQDFIKINQLNSYIDWFKNSKGKVTTRI